MLSDLFKDKLAALDDIAIQALRGAFDEEIEKEKPIVREVDDDIKLGQKTRAFEKSKNIIKKVFENIETYKVNKAPDNSFNKAI